MVLRPVGDDCSDDGGKKKDKIEKETEIIKP